MSPNRFRVHHDEPSRWIPPTRGQRILRTLGDIVVDASRWMSVKVLVVVGTPLLVLLQILLPLVIRICRIGGFASIVMAGYALIRDFSLTHPVVLLLGLGGLVLLALSRMLTRLLRWSLDDGEVVLY